MKFQNKYLVGIGIGVTIILFTAMAYTFHYLSNPKWIVPILIVAVTVSWIQIWIDFFIENNKQKEFESRFLDFVRNLAGAIKSGMPVPRSIIHVSKIDYGPLSPYVRKLGYQVEWAVPVRKALIYFSNSTKNDVIKRAVSTVIEAEQSGGNMEDVLESITGSLVEIKKIKESRRATISSQVMQSYVIFLVFLGVMVVIQNLLVPYLLGSGGTGSNILASSAEGGTTGGAPLIMNVEIRFDSPTAFILTLTHWFASLKGIFVMLSMIQAFFAGVIIGKLSEGDLTSGLKHSIILITISLFVMSVF